jgi:hypothetical protein
MEPVAVALNNLLNTNVIRSDKIKGIATALIIEPRKHKALAFVLKNILENLESEWNVILYHGRLNEDYVKNIVKNNLSHYASRISLIKLEIDNLTKRQYSEIMLNRDFISSIPTETFLVFQTDSMINPKYKDLLYTFLKYDYVGAPWKNGMVGNGGFSLRKKSKMLKCLLFPVKVDYEDAWFSNDIHKLYKPPYELACLFSIETLYSKVFFGIHFAWNYHESKLEEMCENCPGLSELISLQALEE